MNGYVCFWENKKVEIEANSSLEAQQKATIEFQKSTRKKVKGYQVTVVLAEKNNQPVTHIPDFQY